MILSERQKRKALLIDLAFQAFTGEYFHDAVIKDAREKLEQMDKEEE